MGVGAAPNPAGEAMTQHESLLERLADWLYNVDKNELFAWSFAVVASAFVLYAIVYNLVLP